MKLDHVVYFTAKTPSQTVEEQMIKGHHAVVGGSHKSWGTQNALVYTRSAYIEYLSVEKQEIAKFSSQPLTQLLIHDLQEAEGWGTMCFSVKDMGLFRERIKKDGFEVTDIFPGRRVTPEGQLLCWKMLFVNKKSLEELPFPFFIEWEESESQRRVRLVNNGSIMPENEQLEIEKLILTTQHPENECKMWAKLVDVEEYHNNELILPNVKLVFVEKLSPGKARLKDVVFRR